MSTLPISDKLFTLDFNKAPLVEGTPEADIKKVVDWFTSFLPVEEWKARRRQAAGRMYAALAGKLADPVGRFFDESDMMAWYLLLGEAYNDHPWNYEPFFGARVIPLFAALGRNLDGLKTIGGLEERVRRMLTHEKGAPNGPLFEMLVASQYQSQGYTVTFKPELPGIAKTYDMDVCRNGRNLAVECKRMELTDYAEAERSRMRVLWRVAAEFLQLKKVNVLFDVVFNIELKDVPDNYLLGKCFLAEQQGFDFAWQDATASGHFRHIDLAPLQARLVEGEIKHPSSEFNLLMMGEYDRDFNLLSLLDIHPGMSPSYVRQIDQAIVGKWSCIAPESLSTRAKDIFKVLIKANDQLPSDVSSIVHIGIEAVAGNEVESQRFAKIKNTVNSFSPKGSALHYVYCHWFAPEAPPDDTWAIDETVHVAKFGKPPYGEPLNEKLLIVPSDGRNGTHWDMTARIMNARRSRQALMASDD